MEAMQCLPHLSALDIVLFEILLRLVVRNVGLDENNAQYFSQACTGNYGNNARLFTRGRELFLLLIHLQISLILNPDLITGNI